MIMRTSDLGKLNNAAALLNIEPFVDHIELQLHSKGGYLECWVNIPEVSICG